MQIFLLRTDALYVFNLLSIQASHSARNKSGLRRADSTFQGVCGTRCYPRQFWRSAFEEVAVDASLREPGCAHISARTSFSITPILHWRATLKVKVCLSVFTHVTSLRYALHSNRSFSTSSSGCESCLMICQRWK